MSKKFPVDRFDDVPPEIQRVGAHRSSGRSASPWVIFAWAALVTGLIVGGSTVYLLGSSGKLQAFLSPLITPSPTPTPTAKPTVAPDILVNVFNATPIVGLATTVGDQLAAAGVLVGVKSNASVTDTKKTIVFYSTTSTEGAARGVCAALDNSCQIKLTSAYASSQAPLTLVLGADYVVPTVAPAPVEPAPVDGEEG
jgi:hypothetical protein